MTQRPGVVKTGASLAASGGDNGETKMARFGYVVVSGAVIPMMVRTSRKYLNSRANLSESDVKS
jgi:hypothetical protein